MRGAWVVTVYYHCRLVDIRYFPEERKARDFYAESLVRYSTEYDITIAKQ